MMSGYEIELYKTSHNPLFATILLVLFVFIMCIVLLNCLIALMSGELSLILRQETRQLIGNATYLYLTRPPITDKQRAGLRKMMLSE